MRDGSALTNHYRGTVFGVDDHAILDVGVRTNDDRLNVPALIHLIRTDDSVRTNEHVLADLDTTTDDGGGIDKAAFVDNG